VTSSSPWSSDFPYAGLVGVGGIGTGLFFALEGDHTLGRNESRPGRLLDVRDYCKLHIIAHYVAVILGAGSEPDRFHVLPIGKVGDDGPGRAMLHEMAAAGMDTRNVVTIPDRPTTLSVCFQYPDGSGGNITTSDSAAVALTGEDIDDAMRFLRAPAQRYIALAAPEVPLEARLYLLRRASSLGALRVACLTSADAIAEERAEFLQAADLVALNEDEAGALIGQALPTDDVQPFLQSCRAMLQSYNPKVRILLSAGERGAYAFDGSAWGHRPALKVPVVNTAGAGDALLAGVLSGLALGIPLIQPRPARNDLFASALDLGVLLASFSVTSPHTIHPDENPASLAAFAGRMHLTLSRKLEQFLQARKSEIGA
jgi:sugar/nucleoside kinase (ribokinase family)